MKLNILIPFTLFLFISCQKNERITVIKKDKKELTFQELSNKVFYISPQLNTEQCTAYNDGCDCCDGKIVFLKNGTFISNFYCIPEESFNTGTFKVVDSRIKLHYSKKSAILAPEDENDFDANSVLKLDSIGGGITFLDILPCGNKYVFKSKSDEYYSEDKTTSFEKAVNEYKKNRRLETFRY